MNFKNNIPNILTTFRFILIPFFVYFTVIEQNLVCAAILFVAAGVTDIVDGFIARKFNMITDFGKLYDPLVDKLFNITAVICLFLIDILPDWIVYFILLKEGCMFIISTILYTKKIVVHSYWYGKAAAIIFYAAIFVMLITQDISAGLTFALLCAVVASAVLSAAGYFVAFVLKR